MVDIMNILILGGTAWLSSTIARTATGRGHHVTCAARGTDTPPQGCAFIPLDRNQPDAYATLPNITWDAVVDVTTSRDFAADAITNICTNQWVYVSSASVYADMSDPNRDETTPWFPPRARTRPAIFRPPRWRANNNFPQKPPVSSGPASSAAPATPPAAAATIHGGLPTPPARRYSPQTAACRWP